MNIQELYDQLRKINNLAQGIDEDALYTSIDELDKSLRPFHLKCCRDDYREVFTIGLTEEVQQ